MEELTERMERRNVSIYPRQWDIVDEKACEIGSPANTSAGLRAIIAEYERLRAGTVLTVEPVRSPRIIGGEQ
jgi:hypothetical protein